MKTRQYRQTLSNRADRLDLVLTTASRETVMDALSQGEPRPRWELSDGKHRSSVRSFLTLADVAAELDWQEVDA